MAPQLIVFDLDGTLIDSHADIYQCVVLAMAACGRPEVTFDAAEALGGVPLHAFHEHFRPDGTLDHFVRTYRRFQDTHGLATTTVYPGVRRALAALAAVPLAVASTKPTHRVVEHARAMGLDHHFDLLQGTEGPPYKPDPAVLYEVLAHFDVDPARCWMVGDQVTDVQAGRAAGMRTIGVTCSATTGSQHRRAGADVIVEGASAVPTVIQRAARAPSR
jgi:phosphoglycolate phosphatase